MSSSRGCVGFLIRNRHGKYLVQFRDNAPECKLKLHFGTFGGQIDEADAVDTDGFEIVDVERVARNCAAREFEEELGVAVTVDDFRYVGFFNKPSGPPFHCLEYLRTLNWRDFDVLEGAGAGFYTPYELSVLKPFSPNAREMFRLFAM